MESKSYKLSATVASKYAPLISRGRGLHEQTHKSQFPTLREAGATHVDLWSDGLLYPHHPVLGKRPGFRSVSGLLEFVGEGKNGLLGYIESLCVQDRTTVFRIDEGKREVQSLREHVLKLMNNIEEKNRLLEFANHELQARETVVQQSREALLVTESLRNEVLMLREESSAICSAHEERNSSLLVDQARSAEESFQMKLDLSIELDSERKRSEEKLKSIQLQLNRTKATLRRREAKPQKLVKTPFGYRSSIRPRKDLCDLAPGGGHAKRTIKLARAIIAPTTSLYIQSQNQETGSRQRL